MKKSVSIASNIFKVLHVWGAASWVKEGGGSEGGGDLDAGVNLAVDGGGAEQLGGEDPVALLQRVADGGRIVLQAGREQHHLCKM